MSSTSNSFVPGDSQGIVSLTFDDGCPSQLKRALPVMQRLGLRGTFYLNPRDECYREQLPPWRIPAAVGHEIGNHTCKHRCSRSVFPDTPQALEDITLEDIEADILLAEERLAEMIPDIRPHTFCYPCYDQHVGRGTNRRSYTHIVAKHFIAGRGGTCNRGFLAPPAVCDLSYLPSQPADVLSGYEMIGLAERAAVQHKWLILTFHGIEDDWLATSEAEFTELCEHLARHRERLWTAPVVEVAQRIANCQLQIADSP